MDAQRVAAVRRFNRFYTQHLGVLQDGWLDSPFSLSEARVLYEIKRRDHATASDIARGKRERCVRSVQCSGASPSLNRIISSQQCAPSRR